MSNDKYKYKLLGLVTLYNPVPAEAAANIGLYINDVDRLVVWDNSPLECNLQHQILPLLDDYVHKIEWKGDGQNHCIAPAINFAWHFAEANGYDLLLLMDDDSRWQDFTAYRKAVETLYLRKGIMAFTPYVDGCDNFPVTEAVQYRLLFINSGTVLPTKLLSLIGGVDEKAFPLDALDHDMSLDITERGYGIACLTAHRLIHSLGHPQLLGPFRMFTPNYNRVRTYSMTRSHTICYRKHRRQLAGELRKYYYQEILLWKFLRIIFAEPDKAGRMKAFFKGLYDGLMYKLR